MTYYDVMKNLSITYNTLRRNMRFFVYGVFGCKFTNNL